MDNRRVDGSPEGQAKLFILFGSRVRHDGDDDRLDGSPGAKITPSDDGWAALSRHSLAFTP